MFPIQVSGSAPQLITIGADKTLAIYDTMSFKIWDNFSDGTCTRTLHQHTDYVTCLASAEKNDTFTEITRAMYLSIIAISSKYKANFTARLENKKRMKEIEADSGWWLVAGLSGRRCFTEHTPRHRRNLRLPTQHPPSLLNRKSPRYNENDDGGEVLCCRGWKGEKREEKGESVISY
ncbi:hypothetical protein LXL04_019324 [Taraxacum kok-saghyz]